LELLENPTLLLMLLGLNPSDFVNLDRSAQDPKAKGLSGADPRRR
jgi:hypothetical protein